LGTVQSTLGLGGCDREIFASATCSLQFAKAAVATGEERLGRFAAKESKYIHLYRYSGKLALAAMYLRHVVGRSFAAGAPALMNVCTVGACGTKPRRGPPEAQPVAGVWRLALGDGAHCPSTARHAAFNDQILTWSLS
jgi:hypothetical protein